jgi:uncharacterized BrkB/YihY/UPF0761 family membrane protein
MNVGWRANSCANCSASLAEQIDSALQQSATTRWFALLSGLFGAAWAGRTLAKVLTAASRRAWRVSSRPKATVRIAGAITGLIAVIGLLAAVINRIREAAGFSVATTAFLSAVALYALVWFVVLLLLPHGDADPSALLPGAAVVGLVLAGMQWFVQLYLPGRINKASELYGAIGASVVALGWFFFVGRLFVVSLVLNATVWEQYGSLSGFVFRLPLLRRIPRRWPAVADFFGLRDQHDATHPFEVTPHHPR